MNTNQVKRFWKIEFTNKNYYILSDIFLNSYKMTPTSHWPISPPNCIASLQDFKLQFAEKFHTLDTAIRSNQQGNLLSNIMAFQGFLIANDSLIQDFLREQITQRTNHLRWRTMLSRSQNYWRVLIRNMYTGCLKLMDWLVTLLTSQAFNIGMSSEDNVVLSIWNDIISPSFLELKIIWAWAFILPDESLVLYPEAEDILVAPSTRSHAISFYNLTQVCSSAVRTILAANSA